MKDKEIKEEVLKEEVNKEVTEKKKCECEEGKDETHEHEHKHEGHTCCGKHGHKHEEEIEKKKAGNVLTNITCLCFHYTIDEHITAFDFCNLLFRFVFVRNLASRFNQIAHDLIELRSAF